jgi:hypothetical protein
LIKVFGPIRKSSIGNNFDPPKSTIGPGSYRNISEVSIQYYLNTFYAVFANENNDLEKKLNFC